MSGEFGWEIEMGMGRVGAVGVGMELGLFGVGVKERIDGCWCGGARG